MKEEPLSCNPSNAEKVTNLCQPVGFPRTEEMYAGGRVLNFLGDRPIPKCIEGGALILLCDEPIVAHFSHCQ